MIFVTIGTTIPFDELIEAADGYAAEIGDADHVICQIGNGSYIPKHCEYFRFRDPLDDLYEQADVIIGHGGTGTTLELIQANKKFVSFANPKAADDHQREFLEMLEGKCGILWSRDCAELPRLIEKARTHKYKKMDEPNITDDLIKYIDGL